ncbi:hypothetical protein L596_027351 [Steinernema carpocapsae]|uniref:Uncharacterized protein n=1 Tax=Steinernema carpocapsae TaxID=34508 RepID=A0A4V5ZYR0_STECR|nr:hypothetical protein L596_027351 [Steinernema carpocapsae]
MYREVSNVTINNNSCRRHVFREPQPSGTREKRAVYTTKDCGEEERVAMFRVELGKEEEEEENSMPQTKHCMPGGDQI